MKNWDIHPEAELELEEAIANYLSIDENWPIPLMSTTRRAGMRL
jgi:hypothetical protein